MEILTMEISIIIAGLVDLIHTQVDGTIGATDNTLQRLR